MKKITLTILSVIAAYLSFAYIETELNPIEFGKGAKVFFLLFLIVSAIGGFMILSDKDKPNTKQLIAFANHMMKQIKTGDKQPDPSGDFEVTDADLNNWKNDAK